MIEYGFVKQVSQSFEDVCSLLPDALQKEGFGILTNIDIQEKLKEKLGVHVNRYIIFGACNPPNAFKALSVEQNIGLMLPCNVVVYEKEKRVFLAIIKPTVAMNSIRNEDLKHIAISIEEKLKAVFDSIS